MPIQRPKSAVGRQQKTQQTVVAQLSETQVSLLRTVHAVQGKMPANILTRLKNLQKWRQNVFKAQKVKFLGAKI